jgi:hypothetical protein
MGIDYFSLLIKALESLRVILGLAQRMTEVALEALF